MSEDYLTEEDKRRLAKVKAYFDALEGKTEFREASRIMLNPEKLITSTRLSAPQIRAVALTYSGFKQWPFFSPLKEFIDASMEGFISLDGKSRKEVIDFHGATFAREMLKRIGIVKEDKS